MVVEVKKYFEKTRHVKNNDKSKKYILRGQRNTRYYEEFYQIKRNHIISHNFTSFLGDYNRYGAENFNIHYYFNELSNDISHFVVAQNFITSTCLSKVLTINFLEDYIRYRAEIFRVI